MPSRFHVLIVEDEPLIVEVLQGALELEYRVSSANTAGQALRGIALDPDNPEVAYAARMRPASKVLPKVVEAYRRGKLGRPAIGDEPKVHIGFRLAADVVAGIRATGRGYNARVEKLLRVALSKGRL
jgi:uncharacterized protein (DUF4415 family)